MRRVVRRVLPSALAFTPREGGRHLVRVGELAHNRGWGSLLVRVAGMAFNFSAFNSNEVPSQSQTAPLSTLTGAQPAPGAASWQP